MVAALSSTLVAPKAANAWLSEPLTGGEMPRIGAVVPKRLAKRAVTRNTIKRQIYAAAFMRSTNASAAQVVRLRREFDRKLFVSATSNMLKQAVREELQQLFAKAGQT